MADESETPKTASNAPNTVSEQKIFKSNKTPFIIFLKIIKAVSRRLFHFVPSNRKQDSARGIFRVKLPVQIRQL